MGKAIRWAGLLLFFAVLLFPIFLMVTNSFTPVKQFMSYPPKFLPYKFTWANYIRALTIPELPGWLANTGIVVGLTVFLGVVVNGAGGYVFAFARMRWLKVAFWLLMLPIFTTEYVMIIPRYVIVNQLKLRGLWAVIPMTLYGPGMLYLFRNYFATIPISLVESARLDGASEATILFRVVLPICKPIVGTAIVFIGMGALGDWIWQLLNLKMPAQMTVLVGWMRSTMEAFVIEDIGYNLAIGTLLFLPYMIIFALSSRYFVKGLTGGALK